MSSMLDILEKEMNKLNIYEGNLPSIVEAIANSIPSQTIPYRMKLAIAVAEIILFTSQFRKNIKHWNGSIIPINSLMFCVAKSGASKDSSVKAARKCFEGGYELINQKRKDDAVVKAIKKALDDDRSDAESFAVYKDYFVPPNPLFVAISTTEGFVQHLNDISEDTLGAGFIYSGEVGAELATNTNLVENIKILAELYDEGSKEVKILKSRENQSKEVKNLPVSALFMGSQDNLLYDDAIKRKFKTEFNSKLARRSFFIFVNEDCTPTNHNSISDLILEERKVEDNAIEAREEVSAYITDLATYIIREDEYTYIKISEKARDLFSLYKRYNEEVASTIDSQYSMAKLTRNHLQWKALKLAGAFAIIEGEEEITEEHYKGAMQFLELINKDMSNFEKELVKEPYELFADYCRFYAVDNEYSISLHNLRKCGFIPLKGQSATNLKELVKLVSSYDENGIYQLKNDIVHFKEVEKTDDLLISYLSCTGSKQERVKKCNAGFECQTNTFSAIGEMLLGDFAYSPFKFKNGIRGKDNIESGCKWIVLDIDTSEITDYEAHILLADLNHYVVRTSKADNANKFRAIIELDMEVDIPDTQWKQFISSIVKDLGLVADPLPKSQIFFSYADRQIYSQLDGNTLEIKPYIDLLHSQVKEESKALTKEACINLLDDSMSTFARAYNAPDGQGRQRLIWAVRYARELGATKEYCKNLLDDITNYWVRGFPEKDLNIMKDQVDRWNF